MTRKPKKVEFHFDERSIVTAEEVAPGEYGLVGFNDEQMKILQSYRLELHNTKMALKYAHDENQRVRMALMPLLESEDPAEAVDKLRADLAVQEALAIVLESFLDDARVAASSAIDLISRIPYQGSTPELRQQVIDGLRKIVSREEE